MTAIASGKSLPERIYQGLSMGGKKAALIVNGQSFSYEELKNAVFCFAHELMKYEYCRLAIITRETLQLYQSLLAAIMSATEYVPITPVLPPYRLAFIIAHSQCTHVFVDSACVQTAVDTFLEHMDENHLKAITVVALPETALLMEQELQSRLDQDGADKERIRLLSSRIHAMAIADNFLESSPDISIPSVNTDDLLHILYTSGTTGNPKGVMITHGNYSAYLDKILDIYRFKSTDVFSHFAEINFDVSLADPLCAIICGGTVVCPDERDRRLPHKYIMENGITVIQSVPSLVAYMHRIRLIDRVKLESVRMAIFTGEALWYSQLRQFHRVCPNARLFNAYGPTEATVHINIYEALADELGCESIGPDVPIGRCLDRLEMMVVNEHMEPVPEGESGELLVSGDQVSPGYWNIDSSRSSPFINLQGRRWYRTGDTVIAVRDAASSDMGAADGKHCLCYRYLGRNDDMVKVSSYRVSLYDVEEKMALLTDRQVKAVKCCEPYDEVDHPMIVAAVEGADQNEIDELRARMPQVLPAYMLPRYMTSLPEFPLNTNGKIDRRAIKEIILKMAPKAFGLELHP